MRSTYVLPLALLITAVFAVPAAAQTQAQTAATPTPVLASNTTPLATPTPGPGGLAAPSSTPAPSDQIASVAAQVAAVANDPTMTVDVKTQQINALAAQFNQLVLVWQQQVAAIQTANPQTTPVASGLTGSLASGVGSTPTPFGSGSGSALTSGTPIPSPTPPGSSIPGAAPSATSGPLVSLTIDQVRAQISAVSQRMTTVSNDPTLSPSAKTKQLQDLGNQFNQLVQQLHQMGG